MSKIRRGGLRPLPRRQDEREAPSSRALPGLSFEAPATSTRQLRKYRRQPVFRSAGVLAGSFRFTTAPPTHVFACRASNRQAKSLNLCSGCLVAISSPKRSSKGTTGSRAIHPTYEGDRKYEN